MSMLLGHCLLSFCWRMPWRIVRYLSVILPLAMSMVSVVDVSEGKNLRLDWNSTNPLFRSSDLMLDIQYDDNLFVYCPHYTQSRTSTKWWYFLIYKVSQQEYNECKVWDTRNATLIVNCSDPNGTKERVAKIWITNFNPVFGAPDFKSGNKYYFVSTSTGTKPGLGNQVGGTCLTDNMKLVLKVWENNNTLSNTTHAPPQPQTTRWPPVPPPTTKSKTTTKRTTRKPTTRKPTTPVPVTTSTVKVTTTKAPTKKYPPIPGQKPPLVTSDPGSLGLINSARTVSHHSPLVLGLSILLFILTFSSCAR